MGLIIRAARTAAEAHAGSIRKYNGRPYISHPIRVAGRVATHARATDELVAAAFLHDTLEDTSLTYVDLKNHFGQVVANYVQELTNAPNPRDLPRAHRKQRDRDRLRTVSDPAKIVKLIDRIDNLLEVPVGESFAVVYAKESLLLAEVLAGVDLELDAELIALVKSLLPVTE